MINVCANCGQYRADKTVQVAEGAVVCPECGHAQPFTFTPIFLIGGPSGAGKSAVLPLLTGHPDFIALEMDILWQDTYNNDNTTFFETWLRMAKNISQSGKPVALLGAGVCVPANITACVESRYFSAIHYLALSASDDTLKDRLLARPAWRNSHKPEFIESQIEFNRWLKNNRGQIDQIDTTTITIVESANQIKRWITQSL